LALRLEWSDNLRHPRHDTRLPIPDAAIADLCRKWQVTECALFGSVLRHDFGPDSDVDVLVSFAPEVRGARHERLAPTGHSRIARASSHVGGEDTWAGRSDHRPLTVVLSHP